MGVRRAGGDRATKRARSEEQINPPSHHTWFHHLPYQGLFANTSGFPLVNVRTLPPSPPLPCSASHASSASSANVFPPHTTTTTTGKSFLSSASSPKSVGRVVQRTSGK